MGLWYPQRKSEIKRDINKVFEWAIRNTQEKRESDINRVLYI